MTDRAPQDERPTPWQPDRSATTEQQHERGHPDHSASGVARAGTAGHGGHRLMMIACCVPMLVVAGILVFTGVAGYQAILVALVCTAMMAAMMLGMPGGHRH